MKITVIVIGGLVVVGIVTIVIFAQNERARGSLYDPTRSAEQRGQDAADFARLQVGLATARQILESADD